MQQHRALHNDIAVSFSRDPVVLNSLRSSKLSLPTRTSTADRSRTRGAFVFGAILMCLHAAAMLYRFGSIPNIPVFGDEIVINDPAIAISRGQGLIAPSFADSISGIDKLYAHFPPVYIFLQAGAFRVLGISAHSLRLLTTIFSIAAVFMFLILVNRLCSYRMMTQRTGFFVSCLYALSAPVIILHRISRMESLIELLSLITLYCALTLLFGNRSHEESSGTRRRQSRDIARWLTAASAAGVALGSHPEAINAILPAVLIILISRRVRTLHKITFVAVILLTPAVIWIATYGSRSWAAVAEMAYIATDKAPDPSMPQFGMDLLKKAVSSEHDLMVFFFFSLTVIVLIWALIQVVRAAKAGRVRTGSTDEDLHTLEKALAIAVPVTFLMLLFLLPASITRYEVIYPIYLVLIAVLPVSYIQHGPFRPYVVAAIASLIVGQFFACILYLAQNRISSEGSVKRYDFVLDCIPGTARIAASPQLWLAFQTRNRPFTLLYPGLDGLENWKRDSSNPLDRFDVILLTDYVKDDLNRYAPLSAPGHEETDVRIGARVLRMYSHSGIFKECDGTGLHP